MTVATIEDIGHFDGQSVTLRGWLYNKRKSGKLQFLILRDGTGFIQAVAFKKDVDEAFAKLIRIQLKQGYAAIATHDEAIIDQSLRWIKDHSIPHDKFEFQMLYGIREDLQKKLAGEGYRVRVYVPYGKDWFGYFMRRLAERPANVWFVLKNMRRKK